MLQEVFLVWSFVFEQPLEFVDEFQSTNAKW